MKIKHILGLLIMYFLATLTQIKTSKHNINYNKAIYFLVSIILYLVFLVISKTHYIFLLLILFIIFILYILNIHIYEYLLDIKINHDKDIDTEDIEINGINTSASDSIIEDKVIYIINIILIIIGIILLIYGLLINLANKKKQYGRGFNYKIFLLGVQLCKTKSKDSLLSISSIIKILKTKYK